MPSHPNRGNKTPASNPTPEEIKALRESLGMTQNAAAATIHASARAWQDYEAGARRMHPGLWELFRNKTRKR